MGALHHFFVNSADTVPFLEGRHSALLVLLSIGISVFSASMALASAHVARRAETALSRHVAIASGAAALGGGICATHFIGMLAFKLPTHVSYELWLTTASILPALGASWLALRILARAHVTFRQLLLSGALTGAGIGTMHYAGMAAMDTPVLVRYEPTMFLLSIAVAVGLSMLALWIRYGLRNTRLSNRHGFYISGAVMGFAIAGMHYTGMAAVRLTGVATTPTVQVPIDAPVASILLATLTITLTLLVYASNHLIRARAVSTRRDE